MLEDSKLDNKGAFSISTVQRYIFWSLIFLLPLAIMPFPWDWTERGMSLLILSSSTLILGLECIKLIWVGKTSILKNILDVGLLLLLLSMLFSTIFSVDINVSLWGIDGKLGSGLIVFICIFLLSISARTFIESKKHIRITIILLLSGLFINNIMSVLSFRGINIFEFIPVYRDLYQKGIPMMTSLKLHVFINLISVILNIGLIGEYLLNRKKHFLFILSSIFLMVSLFNIYIFSISQRFAITIMVPILLTIFLIFTFKYNKSTKEVLKKALIPFLIVIFVILVLQVALSIDGISKIIIPKNLNFFSQISLGLDISWRIASSVFVMSFLRGLLGMGVDTFSIAYYLHRPLDINVLALNRYTFYSADNEVFTQFANGGLIWLFVWLFIGFLIIKAFIQFLRNFSVYRDDESNWYILIFHFLLIFLYISSLFSSYNVLVFFILFLIISLQSVFEDILKKKTADKFIVKVWTVDLSVKRGKGPSLVNLNLFLTLMVSIVVIVILGIFCIKIASSVYILKAESFSVRENQKYLEKNVQPTFEERESFIDSLLYFYNTAARLDKNSPLVNRKKGLMYLERIVIEGDRYAEVSKEDIDSEVLTNVSLWKGISINAIQKSVEGSPSSYLNWEAATRVYMGLLSLGFYDHIQDSIYSLERALELNPLNFELYYSKAQVHIIKGEKDEALTTLTSGLAVNPQYIPSIMLTAYLNKEKGNTEIYASYLKVAKKIIEEQGATDQEIYREIMKELNILETDYSLEEETLEEE